MIIVYVNAMNGSSMLRIGHRERTVGESPCREVAEVVRERHE